MSRDQDQWFMSLMGEAPPPQLLPGEERGLANNRRARANLFGPRSYLKGMEFVVTYVGDERTVDRCVLVCRRYRLPFPDFLKEALEFLSAKRLGRNPALPAPRERGPYQPRSGFWAGTKARGAYKGNYAALQQNQMRASIQWAAFAAATDKGLKGKQRVDAAMFGLKWMAEKFNIRAYPDQDSLAKLAKRAEKNYGRMLLEMPVCLFHEEMSDAVEHWLSGRRDVPR